jgi:tetraprenyl-beta-curcumene synthase
VLANARYWTTVAPVVRAQLQRWERRAHAIPNFVLQTLALDTLHRESFNAEVAATLATLAPRAHRQHAVEAIVALEVLYDYLDRLVEQATNDPLRNGHQLFGALIGAVTAEAEFDQDYYQFGPARDDGGYLKELASVVRTAVGKLPAAHAIGGSARSTAALCADAQVRVHAVPRLGVAQLDHWATREAAGTAFEWREFLAGAVASVLAIHALIAVAADRHTTPEQAQEIVAAYLPISALSTILDSLVDYTYDTNAERAWFIELYEHHDYDLIEQALTNVARLAATRVRNLPSQGHHLMTLAGVVTYYTSAPTANSQFARPLVATVHRELQPVITPTLAVMRAWRLAKQLHRRWQKITRHRQPR